MFTALNRGGLVLVGILAAFGRSTGTVLVTIGIVIMKMMSNTNMTSTSGVVLIAEIASSSPSDGPTLIAMAYALVGADSSTACRSEPKLRTRSIAALLRRMSQL